MASNHLTTKYRQIASPPFSHRSNTASTPTRHATAKRPFQAKTTNQKSASPYKIGDWRSLEMVEARGVEPLSA